MGMLQVSSSIYLFYLRFDLVGLSYTHLALCNNTTVNSLSFTRHSLLCLNVQDVRAILTFFVTSIEHKKFSDFCTNGTLDKNHKSQKRE
jgi:hypothetical protein